MRIINNKIFGVTCASLFFGMTVMAFADNFQITPSIAVKEEYNDNISFNIDDPVDDYITTLNFGLEGANRTERMNLKFNGLLLPFYYRTRDDLNDMDLDFKAKIDYQSTPNLSLYGKGAYRVDNRPDRDIDATGLIFENNQRHRYRAGAGAELALTEINNLTISYTYDQDDWRGVNTTLELKDYTGHSVGLSYNHNISRWLRASHLIINTGYGDYDYENVESNSTYANIGLQRMLSEIFQLQLSVGLRHTNSDYVDQTAGPSVFRSSSTWNSTGTFGLYYAGERTTGKLTLYKDIRSAGGTQGPANLTRAILEFDHRILEKMTAGITASYFLNKADANEYSAIATELTTYHIRPRIRWHFLDQFTLEGGYNYTQQRNDVNNTKTDRHMVYLQLGFSFSLFDLMDNVTPGGNTAPSDGIGWSDLN